MTTPDLRGLGCTLLSVRNEIEQPFDVPDPLEPPECDEPSDLDDYDLPCTDDDDARWEAFIADDDEQDPLPEPGDFWKSEEPD